MALALRIHSEIGMFDQMGASERTVNRGLLGQCTGNLAYSVFLSFRILLVTTVKLGGQKSPVAH